MTHYFLTISVGRTGSTLINSILQDQLPGSAMNQEMKFNRVFNEMIKLHTKKLFIFDYQKEINLFIEELGSMSKYNNDKTDPIYWNVNPSRLNLRRKMSFEQIIKKTLAAIFGNDHKFTGCKMLLHPNDAKNPDAVKLLTKLCKIKNITVIHNIRDFQAMTASRMSKKGFKNVVVSEDMFAAHCKLMSEVGSEIVRYEHLQEDIQKLLSKLNLSFDLDKFKETMSVKHSC